MRAVAAAALLVALAVACARPAAPAEPAPASPAPAAITATPPSTDTSEAGPFLIDPGAEPRYPLRYRVPAGTLRTMTMEYDITMVLGDGPATVMPTSLFTGTYDVLEVDDDGNFTVRMIFDDTDVRDRAGMDPTLLAKMRTALEGIEHMQILGTFTDRGELLSQQVEAGTAASAATERLVQQTSDSLRDAMTRLPVEPVGKGARWTASSQISHGEIRLDSTTEYEVVDVTATTLRLRTRMQMTAPNQPLVGPPAMTVEGTGSGTSDLTIDLTTMVSDIDVRSDAVMTFQLEDNAGAMRMDQQMSMQLR